MQARSWIPWALSGAGAVALATYAVNGRSSSLLAPSVYRGPRNQKAFALTFDDGPSESTPRLLDLLDSFDAKGTFFLVGSNVRRLPHIAREILERGHEVGNHGDKHPYYPLRSARFVYQDIVTGQKAIEDATGFRPWLFRPPFGLRWLGMRAAQHRCGLVGVQWTAIGRDWLLPAEMVAQRLVEGLRPGAILCLHDGRELRVNPNIHNTLTAVRAFLLHRGAARYRSSTVTALFAPEFDAAIAVESPNAANTPA